MAAPFNRGPRGPFDDKTQELGTDWGGIGEEPVGGPDWEPGTEPGMIQTDGVTDGEPMEKEEILSVVRREIDGSLGWTGTRLAEARRRTLSQYFGNPRGDEREGYSQVITRDTFEQVEWAMPDIMEMFVAGPEVVRFIPQGPEDEDSSEQATDACNHVFRTQRGFMVLYDAFKDSFIQKNGHGKVTWEQSDEVCHEDYEGKTLMEFVNIAQAEDYEIQNAVAHYMGDDGEEQEIDMATLAEQMPQLDPQRLSFDIEGIKTNSEGHVRIDNIPPEEFLINRDARGLHDDTCRFVGHRIRSSESKLIALGFDVEIVKGLPGSQSVYTTDQDAIVRASQDDSFPLVYSNRNDSERTIFVTECYLKIDTDGDGISEWWKIVVGGDYGQALLSMEPYDGHPFFSVTPIPIPHRFYGYGLADITDDLQDVNTTLWRQLLNSLYLATDPTSIVLSQGTGEAATPQANLDQLITRTPGSYVEEYTPNAIRPFMTDLSHLDRIIQGLELHKEMKKDRTGVGPEMEGVNADSISKHVYGAMVQSTAAQKRKTLYGRIFAETGVKDLFRLIYQVLLKHQTKPMMIRLRGEWKEVDPRSWRNGMDCEISVGLGHGSRMERVANAQAIGAMQEKVAGAGLAYLVGAQEVYETFTTAVEAMGFKNASKFMKDPATAGQPPPPKPTPADQLVMLEGQTALQKSKNEATKLEIDRYEAMIKAKDVELKFEIEMAKLGKTPTDAPFSVPMIPPPPPQSPLSGQGPANLMPPSGGGGGPPGGPRPARPPMGGPPPRGMGLPPGALAGMSPRG